MILQLLLQIILLSWQTNALVKAQASGNCTSKCGGVDIPFPFGIETGCLIDDWFAIDCYSSKPFVSSTKLEVLEISVTKNTMKVYHLLFNSCQDASTTAFVSLDETPFEFSNTSDRFTGVSCGNLASLFRNGSLIAGCFSICNSGPTNYMGVTSCLTGIDCCQTSIPSPLQRFNPACDAPSGGINNVDRQQQCNYAILVDQQWFENNITDLQHVKAMAQVPVMVHWGIYLSTFDSYASNRSTSHLPKSDCHRSNTTVNCNCDRGYTGNPIF